LQVRKSGLTERAFFSPLFFLQAVSPLSRLSVGGGHNSLELEAAIKNVFEPTLKEKNVLFFMIAAIKNVFEPTLKEKTCYF
jgi:hypothetical protein